MDKSQKSNERVLGHLMKMDGSLKTWELDARGVWRRVVYLYKDGKILCGDCATFELKKHTATAGAIYQIGNPIKCSRCGKELVSTEDWERRKKTQKKGRSKRTKV